MNKSIIVLLQVVIVLLMTSSITAAQESKPRHAPDALPGVEAEMLKSEYWIGLHEDADTVIMTPEEIETFNNNVRNKKSERISYEGPLRNPILPLDLPDRLPGDTLRVWLKSNIDKLFNPDDMWGSRDFYDGRNAIYNDAMKQTLADAMNVSGIPGVITRRFGIVVNHTDVRQYPTHVPGYSDTKTELDRFQITDLCIGNPVAILHRSADGDFLYVESPIARGWIDACDIAIADRGTIRELAETRKFLMATGDKVPIYGDPSFEHFARYFYLSATIPLIGNDSAGYTVNMPYRKQDGSLGTVYGYVKPDADVHIGHLPYTKRSVITQMFKLLNTPYGWHGQDNKRDCVGTLRVVFRCCGLVTGRHMRDASAHRVEFDGSLGAQEKMAAVAKIEPVITAASGPGHIVLYLGKARNGMLYFMHQGGWGYKDEDGTHLIVNRVSINPVNHVWYSIDKPNVFTTMRN